MKKLNHLLWAFCLIIGFHFAANAQPTQPSLTGAEKKQIRSWRKENPNVKMISLQYFLQLSENEKTQLIQSDKRFLYEEKKVRWADIQAYMNTGEGRTSFAQFQTELLKIKRWRLNNSAVKLISMNNFQNMTTEERAHVAQYPFIIYKELLRWADIQAYLIATDTE